MVSIFVGFPIFQMPFLFLKILLNNVYIKNMTCCLCTPNKTVVIDKSNYQISMQKTTQESITTYMLA
jgi:hypothetical protein